MNTPADYERTLGEIATNVQTIQNAAEDVAPHQPQIAEALDAAGEAIAKLRAIVSDLLSDPASLATTEALQSELGARYADEQGEALNRAVVGEDEFGSALFPYRGNGRIRTGG